MLYARAIAVVLIGSVTSAKYPLMPEQLNFICLCKWSQNKNLFIPNFPVWFILKLDDIFARENIFHNFHQSRVTCL